MRSLLILPLLMLIGACASPQIVPAACPSFPAIPQELQTMPRNWRLVPQEIRAKMEAELNAAQQTHQQMPSSQ